MKKLIFTLTLSVAVMGFTETAATNVAPVNAASKRAAFLQKTGGRVDKPGSQQGLIAFINTQSVLDAKEIATVVDKLAAETRYNIKMIPSTAGDPVAVKEAAKASLALIIVNDAKQPTMLVAPEDGWAIVNIAKMDRNLKTPEAKAKFFAGRCRREILRAYSLLCGGGGSQFEGCVMNCAKLESVDLYDEYIPYDLQGQHTRYLKELGITPTISASYIKACYDGWAPAPTNDVQKALWEKVKARKAAKAHGK